MTRFVDPGAVFAGWVGLGMGVVVAIAFELVLAVQPLVFILAPGMGMLIGWYANARSERYVPRRLVLANAAWAGLVTALGFALIYAGLRLVFVYGDSGVLPDGSRLECPTGPQCTYQRYVEAGLQDELAEQGITDADRFEAAVWSELLSGGAALVVFTLVGSLAAGATRALRAPERG